MTSKLYTLFDIIRESFYGCREVYDKYEHDLDDVARIEELCERWRKAIVDLNTFMREDRSEFDAQFEVLRFSNYCPEELAESVQQYSDYIDLFQYNES